MSVEAAYRRVREKAGYWDESGRGRIRVTGKDRTKFLQNMLTADVAALAPGGTTQACALTMKAKLVADMRIHALEESYWIDVDAARAAALLEHLRKFVVINKVLFEDVTASTGAIAIEGPEAEALVHRAMSAAGPSAAVAKLSISGEPGYRMYADRPGIEAALRALAESAGPPVPDEVVEILRVENGAPRFGAELSEDTFPPETGLEKVAISATKGCYLGQEPIARLHFLGHVNKHVTGLVFPEGAPPPALETKLFTTTGEGGAPKEVGRVTSALRSPGLGGRAIALAYVRKEAQAPGTKLRLGDAAAGEAEVRDLPIVTPTKPAPPPPPAAPAARGGPLNPGASGPAAILPGAAPG